MQSSKTKAVIAACLTCLLTGHVIAQTDAEWDKAFQVYMERLRTEDPMNLGFVILTVEKLKPLNPHVSEQKWDAYKKEIIQAASKKMYPLGGKLEQDFRNLLSKMTAKELAQINLIMQKPEFIKHQTIMANLAIVETLMQEFIKNMGSTAEVMEKSAAQYGIKLD
jgi:hypothetical protein